MLPSLHSFVKLLIENARFSNIRFWYETSFSVSRRNAESESDSSWCLTRQITRFSISRYKSIVQDYWIFHGWTVWLPLEPRLTERQPCGISMKITPQVLLQLIIKSPKLFYCLRRLLTKSMYHIVNVISSLVVGFSFRTLPGAYIYGLRFKVLNQDSCYRTRLTNSRSGVSQVIHCKEMCTILVEMMGYAMLGMSDVVQARHWASSEFLKWLFGKCDFTFCVYFGKCSYDAYCMNFTHWYSYL